jgi:hypothetical protein
MKTAKDLQDLKQLYNKDFYQWVMENVELLIANRARFLKEMSIYYPADFGI